MSSSLRAALARFAVRRAAANQRHAPERADFWLRLGCAASTSFSEAHRALVHLRRAIDDRHGAVEAAREAAERFPRHPDAWMLLGDAYQMVFRQREALGAYEEALAIEERADAAMSAGQLYRRAGRFPEAAARFARAYAAGGGPQALWENAQALHLAGDEAAADAALDLWASVAPNGPERLANARAELRALKASAPSARQEG
jgi:tetratricopeptide (TPR) repeat protein